MQAIYESSSATPSLALLKELIIDLKSNQISNIYYLNALFQSSLLSNAAEEVEGSINELVEYCKNTPEESNSFFIYAYLIYFGLDNLSTNPYFQNLKTDQAIHFSDIYVPLDSNKTDALVFLKKAANLGCSEAIRWIGEFYLKGDPMPLDITKAIECFKKAIELNNLEAMSDLAEIYLTGHGVPINLDKAFQLLKQACENGNIKGSLLLATMYLEGKGVLINEQKGLALAEQALNSELPEAYIFIGDLYRDGRAVPQNTQKAIEFYTKTISYSPKGLCSIGYIYEYGIVGIPVNIAKAALYYDEAISRGHLPSVGNLARVYAKKMIPPNYPRVLELLLVASKYNADAMCDLGLLYQSGHIKKNLKEAVKQFKNAVDHNHKRAMNNLGYAYQHGLGVRKNFEIAIQLYEQSATSDRVGMYNLACIYNQKTNPEDRIFAARWFRQSADNNYSKALETLNQPDNTLHYYHYLMTSLNSNEIESLANLRTIEKVASLAIQSPDLLDELIEFDCENTFMRHSKVNLSLLQYFIEQYITEAHNPQLINKLYSGVFNQVLAYEKKLDTVSGELEAFKKLCLAGLNTIDGVKQKSLSAIKKLIIDLKAGNLTEIYQLNDLANSNFLINQNKTEEIINELLGYCKSLPKDGNALFIYAYLVYYGLHDLSTHKFLQNLNANQKINPLEIPLPLDSNAANALIILKKSVELGCSEALFWLGDFYLNGADVPLNTAIAKEMFEKAITFKNSNAMNGLGQMHLIGFGTAVNEEDGLQLLNQAADEGNVNSLLALATVYLDGRGVLIDEQKAFTFAEQASKSNLPDALIYLANLYREGKGVSQNIKKAIALYKEASLFSPTGLYYLGCIYEYGQGVPKNLAKAVAYFEEASSKGDVLSLCNLAQIQLGKNPPDYVTAYNLFLIASKYRSEATCELGSLYQKWESKRDLNKAAKEFEIAAAHFNWGAMNNLGYAFQHGLGVRKDLERAEELYRRSAQEYPAGMYNLAFMYEQKGTQESLIAAARLYRRAADMHSIESIAVLNNPNKKLYYFHYLLMSLHDPSIEETTKLANIKRAVALSVETPDLLDELIEYDCKNNFMKRNEVNLTYLKEFIAQYVDYLDQPRIATKLHSGVLNQALAYEKKLDHFSKELEEFKQFCLLGIAKPKKESAKLLKDLVIDLKAGKLSHTYLLNNLIKSNLLRDNIDEVEEALQGLLQHYKNNPNDRNALYIYANLIYFGWHDLRSNKYFQSLDANPKTNTLELELHLLTDSNKSQALDIFRKSADLGCPEAIGCLGAFYLYGDVVTLDVQKAKEIFEQALVLNNSEVINSLSRMYLEGHGIPINQNKALQLFKQTAETGNIDGILGLAFMYLEGSGMLIDEEKAFRLAEQALESNLPYAFLFMGDLYRDGKGVSQNSEKAIEWYKKAIIFGPEGLCRIGQLYAKGIGVTRNLAKATVHFQEAIARGNVYAMCNLAELLINQIPPNYPKALELLKMAIQRGSSEAMNMLGLLSLRGVGVVRNYEESIIQFKKSSALNNLNAKHNLAHSLEHGFGILKNSDEAVKLYHECSERGHSISIHNLAVFYSTKEKSQDRIHAARLFRRSAEKKYVRAIETLNNPNNPLYFYHNLMREFNIAIEKQTKFTTIDRVVVLAIQNPDLIDELIEFDCENTFMKGNKVNLTFLQHFIDKYLEFVHDPLLINKLCAGVLTKIVFYEEKLDHLSHEVQEFKKNCLLRLDMGRIQEEALFDMIDLVIHTWFYFSEFNDVDDDFTASAAKLLIKASYRIKACSLENQCEGLLSNIKLIVGTNLYQKNSSSDTKGYHIDLVGRDVTVEDIIELDLIGQRKTSLTKKEINNSSKLSFPHIENFQFFMSSDSTKNLSNKNSNNNANNKLDGSMTYDR